jgi:hypothetical protein
VGEQDKLNEYDKAFLRMQCIEEAVKHVSGFVAPMNVMETAREFAKFVLGE